MNNHISNYNDDEHQGLVQKVASGVKGVLESSLETISPNRLVTINVNVQINYASGGGATVNVGKS